MIKNSFVAFIVCFYLSSCQEKTTEYQQTHSEIYKVVDSVFNETSHNIIIYTINPNDCISCLNGFKDQDGQLFNQNASTLYVVKVGREIEKQELKRKIDYFPSLADSNNAIIWSEKIYYDINKHCGLNIAVTAAIIYNFKKDSVLFIKPVREITNVQELRSVLQTKVQ
jgi:hypothetical protein